MTTPPTPQGMNTKAAWRRFRGLLWWSALAGVLAAVGGIWWVERAGTALSLHLMLAMGGGIFLSLMLGGALMGLVFLSNRIGHDEEAASGFEADDRF